MALDDKNSAWLVGSYDAEEQQSFEDVVVAPTGVDAMAKVKALREDYAVMCWVAPLADCVTRLTKLNNKPLDELEKDWEQLVRDHG